MTTALSGMNYVDSNEDYGSNKRLMAAPGFNSKFEKKTKPLASDSNEKPEESKPRANKEKVVASSDSNEKSEKEPKTKKKEIVEQREDFEEVFHKSENNDDDGKKKVSDFVEIYHETETKQKDEKDNKQTYDDKKSDKSGPEKKSDTFDEVFHTTPGISSNQLSCLQKNSSISCFILNV